MTKVDSGKLSGIQVGNNRKRKFIQQATHPMGHKTRQRGEKEAKTRIVMWRQQTGFNAESEHFYVGKSSQAGIVESGNGNAVTVK